MKTFCEIREIVSRPQGALALLSVPSMMMALEAINALLRLSNQICLVGILQQDDQNVVVMAGEVGFLRHATNTFAQELGDRVERIAHTIIIRPHEQLLDWLEKAFRCAPNDILPETKPPSAN
jgi:microcompartment protein CcmL/EutN